MGKSVKGQQGVVLIIALIALVAMSLAGISMMRTVDTTNVISGNLAFNEAAIQMEDVGEEDAYSWIIANPYSNPSGCQQLSSSCPNYYYPNVMPMNQTTKLPDPGAGNTLNWSPASTTGLPSGYSVQYLIERMCGTVVGGTQTVAGSQPTFSNCMASPVYDTTQSPPAAVSGMGRLFFRVTVRVSGPRNTSGQAQYFIGMEDSVAP